MPGDAPPSTKPIGAAGLVRRFLADRGDDGLARELAARAVRSLPDLHDLSVLDVGCGPGYYTAAMETMGARVAAVELSETELRSGGSVPYGAMVGDGRGTPFRDNAFDAVLCSNMLEHTPEPLAVIDEIARVLKPGGWAYLSWTNWLSPWGGHAIAPLHYLGPHRGLRAWTRLFGPPRGKNLPFDGVWPLHIRTVLDHLDASPQFAVDRVEPRYYPWARPIMQIRGVREVLAWNCVIHVTRSAAGLRPQDG